MQFQDHTMKFLETLKPGLREYIEKEFCDVLDEQAKNIESFYENYVKPNEENKKKTNPDFPHIFKEKSEDGTTTLDWTNG